MKLTKTKKRLIAIFLPCLAVLLATFFSLWLTGLISYWRNGMTSLMHEEGNYYLTIEKTENPICATIYLQNPEQSNQGLVLFQDGNAKLVVEQAILSKNEKFLQLNVRCYGDYDFHHTTYYAPGEGVRGIGQVYTKDQSTDLDCVGRNPFYHDYYFIVLSIPNFDELKGNIATLEFSYLIRYSYIRTAIGTTIIERVIDQDR